MALLLGTFNGGATRAKVSTTIGYSRQDFYDIEILLDPANAEAENVYLGPVTVTTAGVDARWVLKPGQMKKFYAGGNPFQIDLASLYIVASAAAQKVHVNALTADGRRIPLQR